MASRGSAATEQRIKKLQAELAKLLGELDAAKKEGGVESDIAIRVQKTQARFRKVRNPDGPDEGIGEFFFLLEVRALKGDMYLPTSVASSQKPTGFVYHIEGTAKGDIVKADVAAGGAGVTQVTVGTIVYTKIPKGKTASFRLLIEIRGVTRNTYGVVINRLNYRHHPRDTRYTRFETELRSKTVRFG